MKYVIVCIIFIVGIVSGVFLGHNGGLMNNDKVLIESTADEILVKEIDEEDRFDQNDTNYDSIQKFNKITVADYTFKKEVLIKYLLETSKKYKNAEAPLFLYLKDITRFIKEKGFESNNFYGKDVEKVEKILVNDLEKLNTNNFDDVSAIIYSIYNLNEEGYASKQECKKFLDSLDNIGSYLSDTSSLLYSSYTKSPFLNVKVDEMDYMKFYNSEKKIINFLEQGMNIDFVIKKAIFGDILWLHQAPTLNLQGLSDAIFCEETEKIEKKKKCNTFKSDLAAGNKEKILEKFKTNERKYDVDAFYIRYLIGDLAKTELTSKLCLID
ncbi:hypothetical protein A9Q91_05305 [Candidatus Gracilibacteria bacterium 28_42_T64]|nr:hypothetical protein A9Q91_05305 [Candidatus Gracilibacteria bacterium 28_42_T64]